MTRWIARHYQAGLVGVMLAVCVPSLPFLLDRNLSFLVYLLSAMAAALAWVALWQRCAWKMSKQAVNALDEGCDPDPLLEYSRDLCRQTDPRRKRKAPGIVVQYINEATALMCLGEYGQADAALDALAPRIPETPRPASFLYWNNRSALYFYQGRTAEMEAALSKAQAIAAGLTLPDALLTSFRHVLEANRWALRYLQDGPTGEVEGAYQALLEAAPNLRLRVGYRVTLGQCAQARGDWATARAHYGFAAVHGGRLAARRQAEGLLAQLGELEAQG